MRGRPEPVGRVTTAARRKATEMGLGGKVIAKLLPDHREVEEPFDRIQAPPKADVTGRGCA